MGIVREGLDLSQLKYIGDKDVYRDDIRKRWEACVSVEQARNLLRGIPHQGSIDPYCGLREWQLRFMLGVAKPLAKKEAEACEHHQDDLVEEAFLMAASVIRSKGRVWSVAVWSTDEEMLSILDWLKQFWPYHRNKRGDGITKANAHFGQMVRECFLLSHPDFLTSSNWPSDSAQNRLRQGEYLDQFTELLFASERWGAITELNPEEYDQATLALAHYIAKQTSEELAEQCTARVDGGLLHTLGETRQALIEICTHDHVHLARALRALDQLVFDRKILVETHVKL